MCGIVGILSGTKTSADFTTEGHKAKCLYQLTIVDTLRGEDSTGILGIHEKHPDNPEIFKKAIPGDSFVYQPRYKQMVTNIKDYPVMVVHNRKATRGTINTTNAHPFEHVREDGSKIAGVHNGSLTYWSNLSGYHKCDVDSDALFYEIAKHGYKDTLEKLQGAFAIVWYDSATKQVHMARNKERPLFFATMKDSDTIVYASEQLMMEFICDRSGLVIKDIYEVEVGNVYTFSPFDNTKVMKDTWSSEEVTLYTPPKRVYGGYGSYDEYGDYWNNNRTYNKRNTGQRIAYKGYKLDDVVELDPTDFTVYNKGQGLGSMSGNIITTKRASEIIPFKMFSVQKDLYDRIQKNRADVKFKGVIKGFYQMSGPNQQNVLYASVSEPRIVTNHTKNLVKGPDSIYTTKENFKEAVKDGCSFCSQPITVKEADLCGWEPNSSGGYDVLCPTCAATWQFA